MGHLLVNSDCNYADLLFSAIFGGLEALPQYKEALRAIQSVGFSRHP